MLHGQKSSTAVKLATGFGVILLFMLTISVLALFMVSKLIQSQDAIVNEYNIKKDISEKMMSFAQRRFLVLARMLNKTDIFDIEDLKMERMEYGAHFVWQLENLMKMPLNEEEHAVIKEIRTKARHSSDTVDALIESIIENDPSVMKRFDEVAMPTQEHVHVALNKFSRLQGTYSKEMAKKSQLMSRSFYILQIVVTVLLISLGGYLAYYVTRKITKTENQLTLERKQALTTLSSISDTVISTSEDMKINFINPAGERLFELDQKAVMGRSLDEVIPINSPGKIRTCFECVFGGDCKSMECPKVNFDPSFVNSKGYETLLEVERSAIYDDVWNRFLGYVIVLRDVTEKRRSERILEKQAKSDNLTRLANRVAFEEALNDVMQESGTNLLCYMDLDRFKIINDTCGHTAGDELLKQVAKLLQKNGRKSDTLARIGGDEFVLIMKDCDLTAGKRYSESIISDISTFRFMWDNKSFGLGISIGIVQLNNHSMTPESALKAADRACYRAKHKGRNTYCVYDPEDHAIVQHTSEVEWCNIISKAIKEDDFILYGQPIHAIGNGKEQMIEVLLRYEEDGRIRTAREFLPAAERYNLASDVDFWVVDRVFALMQQGKFLAETVTVNLSSQSISNSYFRNYIIQQLDALKLDPAGICFEIVEMTAVANILDVTEFMQELKELGCRFAISDFGNGVSSFGYLQALPIDYIKINGEIIKEMVDSHVHYHMAESIHNIANLLNITTIAEHVTDEQTWQSVRDIGIDYAQGFYLGKPQLLDELLNARLSQRNQA